MTVFKLKTTVESACNSTQPETAGSYSSCSSVDNASLTLTEACMDLAEFSYHSNAILHESYIKQSAEDYMFLQEAVLGNIWQKVKDFFQKAIEAITALLTKFSAFCTKLLGQTSRWYKIMGKRIEEAKKKDVHVKYAGISNWNINAIRSSERKLLTDWSNLYNWTNDEKAVFDVFRLFKSKSSQYATPSEVIENLKDDLVKLAKKPDVNEIDAKIKELRESQQYYMAVDAADIETAAAMNMAGVKTFKEAIAAYRERLCAPTQPGQSKVMRDYGKADIAPFEGVIKEYSTLTEIPKKIIFSTKFVLQTAKSRWVKLENQFLAYNDIMSAFRNAKSAPHLHMNDKMKVKRDRLIDTNNASVRNLASAAGQFLSKYANYVVKFVNKMTTIIVSENQTYLTVLKQLSSEGMSLITAYVNVNLKPTQANVSEQETTKRPGPKISPDEMKKARDIYPADEKGPKGPRLLT